MRKAELDIVGGRVLDPAQGIDAMMTSASGTAASPASATCPRPPRISRGSMRPACWSRPAVRLGYQMVGNDPAPALCLARQAADALGLPLMVHVIDMDARERGVVFDVGHGVGSFDCQVAPAAVGHGFAPTRSRATCMPTMSAGRSTTRRPRCRSSCMSA